MADEGDSAASGGGTPQPASCMGHADGEMSPGGWVGTREVLHRWSREEMESEAKFNLKHWFVPTFAHGAWCVSFETRRVRWAPVWSKPARKPRLGAPTALFLGAASWDGERGRVAHVAGKLNSLAASDRHRAKDSGSQAAASWNRCYQSHWTPLRAQATRFATEMFPKRNVLRLFCLPNNSKWKTERRNVLFQHGPRPRFRQNISHRGECMICVKYTKPEHVGSSHT